MLRRLLLIAAGLALLSGCQTDLALVDLKERYGAPPSRFLPMDGIEVHWRDEGPGTTSSREQVVGSSTGAPSAVAGAPATADPARPADVPTLLLLHGTGASLHTWEGWARRLSLHMRVVRLDLPGFGLTGPHPSGDYSGAATADFLERFADAAGLKRFALAGNSLGGYYAWRFALRHPDRVNALILLDSAGYPVEHSSSSAIVLQLARMPVVSELLRWAPVRGTIERSLREVYVDDRKVTAELVDRYSDLMRRPGNRAAFGDRTRAGHRPSGWERLPELRVPTLLMWGGQDTWIPPSVAERFKRDIPGSELIVYPDLGHLPMEEDPARTASDALSFLRRLGAVAPLPQK
jgi:pimeloyl-ACP methyl ester carboxylesterase